MAPKRPLEDPPAASSSESEEIVSEEPEEDDSGSEPEQVEQPIDKKAPTQIKKPESNSNPDPSLAQPDSSSDAATDSGSDSDSESPPPDHHIRPISSKPMEDPPISKKPRSKPTGPDSETPLKPAVPAKRDIDTEDKASRSKRAKKKLSESESEDASKKSTDDNKKFQRLWSEEDEIAILKGVVDFMGKKGANPWTDMSAFHEFIKKSLQVDVSKAQLVDKVRRLKKKYEINVGRGNNGEDPMFSKPHEEKAFELSKRIWGVEKNGVGEQSSPNGKVSMKNSKVSDAKTAVWPRKEGTSVVTNGVKWDIKSGVEVDWSKSRCLSESCQAIDGLKEDEVKEGLKLAGAEKLAELELRWTKLKAKETEVYLERMALLQDQTKLVLNALNAKGH